MSERVDDFLNQGTAALQNFAVTFAQLIASLAVDPHGYFEKKYTARIENACSEQEIRGVLAQLVQWAASSAVSEPQRVRLDNELGTRGMPTIEELRAQLLL